MKKILKITGVLVLTFTLVTNLEYALINYGVNSNSLNTNILAQAGGAFADETSGGSTTVTCPDANYAPNMRIYAVAETVTIHQIKAGTSLSWYQQYVLNFTYNEECNTITETKNCVGSVGACCDQRGVGVTVLTTCVDKLG